MLRMFNKTERHVLALLLSMLLSVPAAWAQGSIDEDPNAFAMAGDLLVARPLGVVMTVAGAAVFVVALPFTLLAGSVSESAEKLVLGPGEATFVRCLGCIESGYSGKDRELREQNREKRESQGE
jgi:hypothetical protein